MSSSILTTLDYIEKTIAELENGIRKRSLTRTSVGYEKLEAFSDFLKSQLPEELLFTVFPDFDRHLHFIKYFLKERDFHWIKSNFNDIKELDFPVIRSEIYKFIEKGRLPKKKREIESLSKDIFLVHGRDTEPVKELKSILKKIGLNPVVLHEQPSGSRTIIEKLEKYSDVGYAFVILTPDDIGVSFIDLFEKIAKSSYNDEAVEAARRIVDKSKGSMERFIEFNMKFMQNPGDASKFLEFLVPRSRQNVVLEFGFFMGILSRDRVCCLYKGDVELPSDMHGIVYIPFKDSISEAKEKIIKELKAAGYKVEI